MVNDLSKDVFRKDEIYWPLQKNNCSWLNKHGFTKLVFLSLPSPYHLHLMLLQLIFLSDCLFSVEFRGSVWSSYPEISHTDNLHYVWEIGSMWCQARADCRRRGQEALGSLLQEDGSLWFSGASLRVGEKSLGYSSTKFPMARLGGHRAFQMTSHCILL